MESNQRVLIIGGGLSALVLAHGLAKQGIDSAVFEKDPTTDYRPQGYRYKLPGAIARELQSVLPQHLWQLFEETCAQPLAGETHVNALNGSVLARRLEYPKPPQPDKMYTVDRAVFRSILLRGLENHVRFGKEFEWYDQDGDFVIAHFKDGTTEQGCMLVGADGSRSRVRAQHLPDHCIVDTGCTCIYGKTPLTPGTLERLSPQVLNGLTTCSDFTPPVQTVIFGDMPIAFLLEPIRFGNRNTDATLPDDYLYWGMSFRNELVAPTERDLSTALRQPADQLTLKLSAAWHPSVRSVLELQDRSASLTSRIHSADPGMSAWQTNPRVTLVGDSVHLMSSAGGVGAVTAIHNAVQLAEALARNGPGVTGTVAEYERGMREFAGMNIRRGFAGGQQFFKQPPFELCKLVSGEQNFGHKPKL